MSTLKETNKDNINAKSCFDNIATLGEENRQSNNMIVLTQNAKINRLIEEINKNYTRKQIAILILEISEKPEICTDFNICLQNYINMYISCREEICLSEIGVFILCAAKIYSRRIDSIFDGIQRMLAGIEKSSKEIENTNLEQKEKTEKQKDLPKPCKRPPKRSIPKDNSLYESEIEPKLFKRGLEEKICDKKSAVNTFEPPKNYFRNFRKYLEYRSNNKKVKKDNSKHDENADPSLYKYSTIEDFDYEDDIDSKRNYRTLHGHIEHRYSTIVSDINFLMHFKVKDFVEEELEQIENQLSLGLPQTPKRKWYSLCHNEYINGVLELENEVLGKEFDTNVEIRTKRRRISCESLNRNAIDVGELTDFDNIKSPIKTSEEITLSTIQNDLTSDEINNEEDSANDIKNPIKTSEEITLNAKQNILNTCDNELIHDVEKSLNETDQTNFTVTDKENVNQNVSDENLTKFELDIKEGEVIDPQKVIVRLSSDDEGIFLSDLDDIQSAMLSPKVVAVDIRKSIDKGLDYFSINLDKTLENFLGVNEIIEEEPFCAINFLGINTHLLSFREDFSLPCDFLFKKTPIVLNILKIPEKILRSSKKFYLPDEYNLYKADRCKKKIPIEKSSRVVKALNSPNRNCFTPLSMLDATDFKGFSQDEIDLNIFSKENIDLDRQRTISTDSGIVISKATHLMTNTDSNHEHNILSSTLNCSQNPDFFNNTDENLSKIISTLSQDEPSELNQSNQMPIIENSILNDNSAKVVDDQIIVPAYTKDQNSIGTNVHETENNQSIAEENQIDDSDIINDENYVNNTDDTGFEDDLLENDDCIENIKMTEKIKLWHKHLKPILAKSKSRHHFDVFNLGTEIMNKFSIKNNNTIDFCAVMQEKDASFTSRYFLSMLLLANTNNIKLNVKNKNSEEPASSKDIEIILLSNKRHTVSVEDNIGMVNCKNDLFPKPKKVLKNSEKNKNDDTDSGFFSNTSSLSFHKISR